MVGAVPEVCSFDDLADGFVGAAADNQWDIQLGLTSSNFYERKALQDKSIFGDF